MTTFVTIPPGKSPDMDMWPAHDLGCPATLAPHCFKGATPAPEQHFRVSRPDIYTDYRCPGHNDPLGRQGHYTDACCATHAARIITKRLITSGVTGAMTETLDVEVWR